MMVRSQMKPTHTHTHTQGHTDTHTHSSACWVPELVAQRRDLPGHALTAVSQLLQLPLQLPLLSVGARVLLLHLLQLPLQLLQPHHGLVQLHVWRAVGWGGGGQTHRTGVSRLGGIRGQIIPGRFFSAVFWEESRSSRL